MLTGCLGWRGRFGGDSGEAGCSGRSGGDLGVFLMVGGWGSVDNAESVAWECPVR